MQLEHAQGTLPAVAAPEEMSPQEQQAVETAFAAAGQVPDVAEQQSAAQTPTASQQAFDQTAPAGRQNQPDLTTPAGRAMFAHSLASGIERDPNGFGPEVQVRDGNERARRTALTEQAQGEQARPGGSGGSQVVGRGYRNYLDFARNDAEVRYAAVLPEVVRLTNERLAAAGVQQRVTAAEIATNFLSEGGTIALDTGQADHLSGFTHAGIDTLIDKRARVTPFAHQSVIDAMNQNASVHTNERNESVTSIDDASIETLAYGNAAMYALMLQSFERDLRNRFGVDPRTFPARGRVFWTCLYFNIGEGSFANNTGARRFLAAHGVNWYQQPYRGRTGVANNMSAQNNATDRAASYELLAMDMDGPQAGGGNDLATAAIGTVGVPLSQLARAGDVVAPDLRDMGLGLIPYNRAVGDAIAIADMVNRVDGVPDVAKDVLAARRQLAVYLAEGKYNVASYLARRSGPAFATLSLTGIKTWITGHPSADASGRQYDQQIVAQIDQLITYTQQTSPNVFQPVEPMLRGMQTPAAGR